MKVFRHFINSFKNMHLSRDEYENVTEEIRNSNFQSVNLLCISVSCIFVIDHIIEKLILKLGHLDIIFFIAFCASIVFLLINTLFVMKNKAFSLPMVYILMTCLYAYGIYVGIFLSPHHEAVTFCVVIFVSPLLFIDRSWRIDAFTIFGCLTFFILGVLFKKDPVFSIDVINIVSFSLLGIIFNQYFNHLKIRDFLILHAIDVDKDYDNFLGVLNHSAVVREIKKNLLINSSTGILLCIDLHNIEKIGEKYGIQSENDVLQQISEQLKKIFRNTDLIGRYERNQFFVFMPNLVNVDIAKVRAKMILVSLAENLQIPEKNVEVKAGIGIAACSDYGETWKSLFRKVQIACEKADSNLEIPIVVYND